MCSYEAIVVDGEFNDCPRLVMSDRSVAAKFVVIEICHSDTPALSGAESRMGHPIQFACVYPGVTARMDKHFPQLSGFVS